VHYDLGLQGLGILIAFSVGFGVVAQVVLWKSFPHWLWLVAGVGWFVGGLFLSEVMFATSTEEDIQPIIDGLAFDESMLGGLIGGLLAVLATWSLGRLSRRNRPI
jgi:hypothetical protein